MGDHTNSKTKLGYSISHNKHIKTKILSILLAILMVSTVFSSITFAKEPNDDSTEEKNIVANILEDVKEKISSTVSKLGSRLREFIDQIRENRKERLSLHLVTKYQKDDSSEIIEKSTPMRLILPTSIDIDGDNDKDIRVWTFRRPALDLQPPAICWKTTLLIRRLPGMDEGMIDDFLEIYLEYTPKLLSDIVDRVRIGYQSPMGEEIPKTCIVTHKTIPHFIYPRQKIAHKITINPISIVGKQQLNLIFSVANLTDEVENFELQVQVDHNPAVKSEIVFERSKDKFLFRGQTLEISRRATSSDVTLHISETTESGGGSVTVHNLPKKISLSWRLAKDGHLKLDTYGYRPGKVEAFVNNILNMGFTPENAIDAGIEWKIPGFFARRRGNGIELKFDTYATMKVSDLNINAPGLGFEMDASLLSLDLGLKGKVGNLVLKPNLGSETVNVNVENAEVVLDNCTVNLKPPEKPTVSITYPEEDSTVSGPITITGGSSAPEGKEIELVQISIDGGDGIDLPVNELGNWAYDWDTTTVPNGDHKIEAQSFDSENVESNPVSVSFTVDSPGNNWYPSVTIESPTELIVSGVVPISGTAYDKDGDDLLVNLEIYDILGNFLGKPVNKEELTVDESGNWVYDWDTTELTAGLYTIYAQAYDGKDYSQNDSVKVWVRLKCNLDFTLTDASIQISNFVLQGDIPFMGIKRVEVSNFDASGSGSLNIADGSVSVDASGSLDIVNASIFTIDESDETKKLLDNLSVDFDGEGNVLLSKEKIALSLDAALSVHADGVLGSRAFTLGLDGTASVTIDIAGEGVLNFGGDSQINGNVSLNIADLYLNVEDLILMGADRIIMNGSGTISLSDGFLEVEGSLDEFVLDYFYINASLGVLYLSGDFNFSSGASIALDLGNSLSFNLSSELGGIIEINNPKIGVITSTVVMEVSASYAKLYPGGYASLSFYQDDLNVTCEVHISDMEIRDLYLVFNDHSAFIPFINGSFHAVIYLSANIKIEMGDDWIKITIGGNTNYIKAYVTFNFNDLEGYLNADLEIEPTEVIEINISGIPDNLAVEIDGGVSYLKATIFEVYLEDKINISITDFTIRGGFEVHASGGNGRLSFNLIDGERIVELGKVYINISDFFDITLQGSINVSNEAGASGILELSWNESGKVSGLYVNAEAYIEIDITGLYLDYNNNRTSANLLLSADQIFVYGGGNLTVTEDYISFNSISLDSGGGTAPGVKIREDNFVLKNFSLNATNIIRNDTGIRLEIASFNMAGNFSINYSDYNDDNGGIQPYVKEKNKIIINASADISGSNIYISLYLVSMELFLSVKVDSFEISGGGTITIMDKNIRFISNSDDETNIVVKGASIDCFIPGLPLILEDGNISFNGISSVDVEFLDDEITITANIDNAIININSFWAYIGLEIRLHSVELTGPTTIVVNLSGSTGIIATIHAYGSICAGEVTLPSIFNMYGVNSESEESEISVGFDSIGNLMIGIGGTWHIDIMFAMDMPIPLNDVYFSGSIAPTIIGFDSIFSWFHLEGAVSKQSTISLQIPEFIPVAGGERLVLNLESGDFMLAINGLDALLSTSSESELSEPLHLDLFGYAESPLEFQLESEDEPFLEYVGQIEASLDINSFVVSLPPDIDINYISFNGNCRLKLNLIGGLVGGERWPGLEIYLSGNGSIYDVNIDGDLQGSLHGECDGTIYFIIPELVKVAVHDGVLNIEWGILDGDFDIIDVSGDADFALWLWVNDDWFLIGGAVPPSEGGVTLLARKSNKLEMETGSIEIIPGNSVNFSAWYTPANFFPGGGSSPSQYDFIFDFGDGTPSETVTVDGLLQDPINIHPSEDHLYAVTHGAYTATVTVSDPDADEDAVDTITINIVEKYLEVIGNVVEWNYEDIDEQVDENGRLHGSFTVKNIADPELSNNYILNWSILDYDDIDWGSEWLFDPDPPSGALAPNESRYVNFSFIPPTEPGDYDATLTFINDNNSKDRVEMDLNILYGLVDLIPSWGTVLLYMKEAGTKTFNDVFWVYNNRWEALEWKVNYSQSHTDFDSFNCIPSNGVMNPGDPLTNVDLEITALEYDRIYEGEIKVERVGDRRDNATVNIRLIVGGVGWILPDDHTHALWWEDEDEAYDDDTGTCAVFKPNRWNWGSDWSNWLTLTLNDPITIKGFRICAKKGKHHDEMEVEFYKDTQKVGDTITFYDWQHKDWEYYEFESGKYEVDTAKIRIHKDDPDDGFLIHKAKVYEFNFWQTLPSNNLDIDIIYDGDKLFENEPFTVHVTNAGTGNDVPYATVTYQNYYNGAIYDTGITNSNGEVSFVAIDVPGDVSSIRCIVHVEATGYSPADSEPFDVYNSLAMICGQVIDSVTDEGIDDVLVVAEPGGYSTYTRSIFSISGLYSLKVPPSTYTITASKDGYETTTLENIIVVKGQLLFLNIYIDPSP